MILRALALVFLLQVAHGLFPDETCPEGYFYESYIDGCSLCTSGCPEGSYIEKPCTSKRDLQCMKCGVVDHENKDYKKKCDFEVDEDFRDAIEKQFRGQLEKTMSLKNVQTLDEEETDSEVDRELVDLKENPKLNLDDILSDEDDEDIDEKDKDDDVAFILNNINDEKIRIGEGARPMQVIEVRRRPIRPRLGYIFGNQEDIDDEESDEIKPVEVDETNDEDEDEDSDYLDEEARKPISKNKNSDELIELEEDDERLIAFEESDDEDKPPFEELLPQKIRKRPLPAVRVLDPLFDLDKEEAKLMETEDESDELDSNEPVNVDLMFERKMPEIVDFKVWMQRRGGGVLNLNEEDFEEEDSDETDEEAIIRSGHEGHNHWLRALFLTGFIVLFIGLVAWIGQLHRRNRAYRYHINKLRYLSPEEREVIERAAGYLQKQKVNVYENHIYETA